MANRRGCALFDELKTADCRFFESCSVYFQPYSYAPCLVRLFHLIPVGVEQGDKNDDAGGRLLAGNTGAFDRLRHPGAFPRFDFGSRGLYCSIELFALGVLFCGDCRKQSAQTGHCFLDRNIKRGLFFGPDISGSGGGNSKKKRYSLNDGTEVEEESDGVYRDVSGSGRTFRDVGGGRVREV